MPRRRAIIPVLLAMTASSACASMRESAIYGAGVGAGVGATAMSMNEYSYDAAKQVEIVLRGAVAGLTVGVLSSLARRLVGAPPSAVESEPDLPAPVLPTPIPSEGPTVDPPVAIEVAAIDTLDAIDATARLVATVRDRTGAAMPEIDMQWQSLTPGVAVVDAGGTVTAVANGEAEVVVTVGELSATSTVVVAQRLVAIDVDPGLSVDLSFADSVQLVAVGRDANGHAIDGIEIEWLSGAPQTVTVDPNGLATANGFGTATVTVRAGDMSVNVTITVSGEDAEEWTTATIIREH